MDDNQREYKQQGREIDKNVKEGLFGVHFYQKN